MPHAVWVSCGARQVHRPAASHLEHIIIFRGSSPRGSKRHIILYGHTFRVVANGLPHSGRVTAPGVSAVTGGESGASCFMGLLVVGESQLGSKIALQKASVHMHCAS
jgi:hypothetical protein